MGAQQSNQTGQLKVLSDYKWVAQGQRDDSIYGDIKIYQAVDDANIWMAIVSKIYDHEAEFHRSYARYTSMAKLNDIPGMIQLYEIAQAKDDSFCSNMYKLNIAFEYQPQNLQQIFDQRRAEFRPFETAELVEFIHQLLNTLKHLERRKHHHGDLRPQNILFDGYNYKISDTHSIDQYRKFIVGLEDHCYLAPEEFSNLSHRAIKLSYSRGAADVFTVGLVFLCLGAFETSHTVYNFDTLQIQGSQIDRLMGQFRENHGPLLAAFITQFLVMDPDLRPSFEELHNQVVNLNNNILLENQKQYQQPYSPQQPQHQLQQQQQYFSNQPQQQYLELQQQYFPAHKKKLSINNFSEINHQQVEPSKSIISSRNNSISGNPLDGQKSTSGRKLWANELINEVDNQVHIPCNPDSDTEFKMQFRPLPTHQIQFTEQLKTHDINSNIYPPTPASSGLNSKVSPKNGQLKRPKIGTFKKENVRTSTQQSKQGNRWMK